MMIQKVLFIVHILLGLSIIGLVLLQRGKGAEAGATFGGASQTVFGSQGSGSFLTRTTTFLAFSFALICLLIGAINARANRPVKLFQEPTQSTTTQPPSELPSLPQE